MNIKSEIKQELTFIKSHKAKYIGSALGLTAGIVYGLGSKRGNWTVVGLAMLGAVGGAIAGGMFEKENVIATIDGKELAKVGQTPVVVDDVNAVNDTVGSDFSGLTRSKGKGYAPFTGFSRVGSGSPVAKYGNSVCHNPQLNRNYVACGTTCPSGHAKLSGTHNRC